MGFSFWLISGNLCGTKTSDNSLLRLLCSVWRHACCSLLLGWCGRSYRGQLVGNEKLREVSFSYSFVPPFLDWVLLFGRYPATCAERKLPRSVLFGPVWKGLDRLCSVQRDWGAAACLDWCGVVLPATRGERKPRISILFLSFRSPCFSCEPLKVCALATRKWDLPDRHCWGTKTSKKCLVPVIAFESQPVGLG